MKTDLTHTDTNKRKRREDDDYDMLPVKIILNNPLRKLLINDWGLVTQNKDVYLLYHTVILLTLLSWYRFLEAQV